MNAAQVCLLAAFLCIAGALVAIGWLLNRLDRRLTELEDRVKVAEINHRTLANETRQALTRWLGLTQETFSGEAENGAQP